MNELGINDKVIQMIERQGQVYIMFGYDDEILELEVELVKESD
jgi:hypothetical protein